jgi:phenylacetic acid degradation operon negative regulatory protein
MSTVGNTKTDAAPEGAVEAAGGDAGDLAAALDLRPLTARSVLLSALLGTHPPRLPVRILVKVGELFEVPEGTVRVALSRMVADGDVVQDDGAYRLTGRLLERHERQDDSRAPHMRPWRGEWEMALVTASGRPAAERAALRRALAELRLAELREGVWVRPDNLERIWSPVVADRCRRVVGRFVDDGEDADDRDDHGDGDDPGGDGARGGAVQLVGTLWDVQAWAERARQLEDALDRTVGNGRLAEGFMVSAAALRHLLADPLLPPELLPDDWPGPRLRAHYERFDAAYKTRLLEHTRA